MTTLIYKGYSITSSLGERNIFLKLVDQVSFATYEATVEQKDLRIQHPLCSVYKVIIDTFSDQDENYHVDINLLSGFLKLEFHALVGGFLELRFEVVLREKVVATDALATTKLEQQVKMLEEKFEQQLTINVDLQKRVEIMAQIMAQYMEKMQSKLSELQEQSEAFSQLEINIGMVDAAGRARPFFFKIGAADIEIPINHVHCIDVKTFTHFYRLRKLKLYLPNCYEPLKSKTIEEVIISDTLTFGNSTCSRGGVFELKYLPNLKKLHIPSFMGGKFNGRPVDLSKYCHDNNIELNIY